VCPFILIVFQLLTGKANCPILKNITLIVKLNVHLDWFVSRFAHAHRTIVVSPPMEGSFAYTEFPGWLPAGL
jgi:hypothetical protein